VTTPRTPRQLLRQVARTCLPDRYRSGLYLLRQQASRVFFTPYDVLRSYSGVPLDIHIADPVAERWYGADWPELPEIDLLRTGKLRPGARVFNVGAHQGIVGLVLAAAVGPQGSVLAVEANAHNAKVATLNASKNRNRGLNVDVLHAAVTDSARPVMMNKLLNGRLDNGSGRFGKTAVRGVTIDDLTAQHGQPAVLFIDIEGAECRALVGAHMTLARRPDCFIEVHVGCGLEELDGSIAELISYFPSAQYRRLICSEADRSFSEFSSDSPLLRDRFFLVALAIDQAGEHGTTQSKFVDGPHRTGR
jgi:FkbM family methyltransferase